MCNITLIGTVHSEYGFCNSNELFKIIEQIAPEIIFEEVPPGKFSDIYEGSRADSLETSTIKRYIKKHLITHYPVDLDTNELFDKHFRNDINELFNIFEYQSPEYYDLSNQHVFMSKRLGFTYLNSDKCKELMERKHFIEEDVLRIINHEKMYQTYKGWLDFIDRRRIMMIKNIYSLSALNDYNRGLFLVGAEHRKPIMDKIPRFEKNSKTKINWNFNYFI